MPPDRRRPDPLTPPGSTRPRGRAGLAVVLGLLPALLGGALWRLDRDLPLWRRPSLWRPAPPLPAPGPLPRLVLAFHYPWYGTPTGPTGRWRHWNHPRLETAGGRILGFHDPSREAADGRLDLGAAHYPLTGPYDSLDRTRIRAQLASARAAGLDGLVVSWWGRESPEARAFGLLLEEAGPTGLRLAPYYETGELWVRGAEGVAADLQALLDRHGRDPAWLRVGRRPVVFLYAAHRLREPAWEYVVRRLRAVGWTPYLVADSPGPDWLAARPGWLRRFDALHLYSPIALLARGLDLGRAYRERAQAARAAGRPFMAPVMPGYDDRPVREPGTAIARDGGRTYEATWRAARAADPAWILVTSWNEWHEGTEIEPSRELGREALEATRARSERFRAGAP